MTSYVTVCQDKLACFMLEQTQKKVRHSQYLENGSKHSQAVKNNLDFKGRGSLYRIIWGLIEGQGPKQSFSGSFVCKWLPACALQVPLHSSRKYPILPPPRGRGVLKAKLLEEK